MNDLDLLRAWHPADPHPLPDDRANARAALMAAMGEGDVAVLTVPSPSPSRRFVGRALIAGVVTVALAVGGFVIATREVNGRIDHVKRVTLPAGTLDRSNLRYPMTMLVVGSDSRAFVSDPAEEQAFGSAKDAGGQRSDVMMLVRLLKDRTDVVSLPRDLMVPDGVGGTRQLNSFFDDGPAALIAAITTNFDVPIDHYVQVDFRAFIKVVDAVGGVRMNAPERVRDTYSGLDLAGAGCTTFDGDHALALVRSRHLEIFDGTRWVDGSGHADLDRIARQQRFVLALLAQTHAAVAADPTRAIRMADAVTRSLVVDSEMSRDTILDLVRRFRADGPSSWNFATIPVVPDPVNRNRLVPGAKDPTLAFFGWAMSGPSGSDLPGAKSGTPLPLGAAC